MAIKPKLLASMGYHIFLTMVLCARVPLARTELAEHCYYLSNFAVTSMDSCQGLDGLIGKITVVSFPLYE